MEKKKHMSLAMQIFVATLLAIFAGVLLQSQADFANNYHQALRHHLPEPGEIHRGAHCAVFHHCAASSP